MNINDACICKQIIDITNDMLTNIDKVATEVDH